jgi:hypothetical protein
MKAKMKNSKTKIAYYKLLLNLKDAVKHTTSDIPGVYHITESLYKLYRRLFVADIYFIQ